MLYDFLCLKPVPLIIQILNLYKNLDLSESMLCVSKNKGFVGIHSVFPEQNIVFLYAYNS